MNNTIQAPNEITKYFSYEKNRFVVWMITCGGRRDFTFVHFNKDYQYK